jgi:hypothetical protein
MCLTLYVSIAGYKSWQFATTWNLQLQPQKNMFLIFPLFVQRLLYCAEYSLSAEYSAAFSCRILVFGRNRKICFRSITNYRLPCWHALSNQISPPDSSRLRRVPRSPELWGRQGSVGIGQFWAALPHKWRRRKILDTGTMKRNVYFFAPFHGVLISRPLGGADNIFSADSAILKYVKHFCPREVHLKIEP